MSVICHVNRTARVILQKAHFELRHVIKFWHCRKLKGFMMIISIAEVPMAKKSDMSPKGENGLRPQGSNCIKVT